MVLRQSIANFLFMDHLEIFPDFNPPFCCCSLRMIISSIMDGLQTFLQNVFLSFLKRDYDVVTKVHTLKLQLSKWHFEWVESHKEWLTVFENPPEMSHLGGMHIVWKLLKMSHLTFEFWQSYKKNSSKLTYWHF